MVPQNRKSADSELILNRPDQQIRNSGLPQQSPTVPEGVPSIDLVGPLLRRKLLIVLLTMLGCALAYLAFTFATPMYRSSARLMITLQTPPTADAKPSPRMKVSIARHERLLASHLILSAAMEKGKFIDMKTFSGQDDIMAALIENVLELEHSKKEEDNSLTISATGPSEPELPIILNQIISAYLDEIAQDSKINGEESLELIAQLRDQLVEEKKSAEQSYLDILRRINLPNVEQNGEPFNPFLEELDLVKQDLSEAVAELRDVTGRVDLAAKAMQAENSDQINYLATEAKKFLGVEIETLETLSRDKRNDSQSYLTGQYAMQVFSLQKALTDTEVQLASLSRVFGGKHERIKGLRMQSAATAAQLKEAQKRLVLLQESSFSESETEKEILEGLEKRNLQWISIYRATLDAENERLKMKVQQLQSDLARVEKNAREVSADVMELGILKARISEKQSEIDDVLERFSELDVVASNFNPTKVRIIDPPGKAEQIAPRLPLYLAAGLFGGGLLGFCFALFIDVTDKTYRNSGEIYDRIRMPVVGNIPPIKVTSDPNSDSSTTPAVISMLEPSCEAAESIREARASLFYAAQMRGVKVVLMTSPSPGDGKSTVAANLAIAIAQAGKSVVLIDADFRRPSVHTCFGRKLEPGIMQVLKGRKKLKSLLSQPSGQKNLSLLTAGGRPSSPGEVVTSSQFEKLIHALRSEFDFVIVDAPPVLPVADASSISTWVDGVYLVMRIRKGVVVTSKIACEKLEMVNANLMGVIVNGVDDNPHYHEYSSYSYRSKYASAYTSNIELSEGLITQE